MIMLLQGLAQGYGCPPATDSLAQGHLPKVAIAEPHVGPDGDGDQDPSHRKRSSSPSSRAPLAQEHDPQHQPEAMQLDHDAFFVPATVDPGIQSLDSGLDLNPQSPQDLLVGGCGTNHTQHGALHRSGRLKSDPDVIDPSDPNPLSSAHSSLHSTTRPIAEPDQSSGLNLGSSIDCQHTTDAQVVPTSGAPHDPNPDTPHDPCPDPESDPSPDTPLEPCPDSQFGPNFEPGVRPESTQRADYALPPYSRNRLLQLLQGCASAPDRDTQFAAPSVIVRSTTKGIVDPKIPALSNSAGPHLALRKLWYLLNENGAARPLEEAPWRRQVQDVLPEALVGAEAVAGQPIDGETATGCRMTTERETGTLPELYQRVVSKLVHSCDLPTLWLPVGSNPMGLPALSSTEAGSGSWAATAERKPLVPPAKLDDLVIKFQNSQVLPLPRVLRQPVPYFLACNTKAQRPENAAHH